MNTLQDRFEYKTIFGYSLDCCKEYLNDGWKLRRIKRSGISGREYQLSKPKVAI